jgi:hypothetical protein
VSAESDPNLNFRIDLAIMAAACPGRIHSSMNNAKIACSGCTGKHGFTGFSIHNAPRLGPAGGECVQNLFCPRSIHIFIGEGVWTAGAKKN